MMKRLSKKFKQFWCEATTACQPQKTLYLVQPSLAVHPLERFMKWNCSSCCSTSGTTFRSDAGIQGWLLPGLGNISLQREGASIVLVWRNKSLPLQSSKGFVFVFLFILYFSFLSFSAVFSLHASSFLQFWKEKKKTMCGKLCLKVKQYITSLQNILDNSLWKDKSTKCACVQMQVYVFVCVQSLWLSECAKMVTVRFAHQQSEWITSYIISTRVCNHFNNYCTLSILLLIQL